MIIVEYNLKQWIYPRVWIPKRQGATVHLFHGMPSYVPSGPTLQLLTRQDLGEHPKRPRQSKEPAKNIKNTSTPRFSQIMMLLNFLTLWFLSLPPLIAAVFIYMENANEPSSKCLTSWHQRRKCLRHCLRLAYARTGFAYAHILSYAELTLAYAHHSFAYATPLQGAPCLTWTQGFKTWLKCIQNVPQCCSIAHWKHLVCLQPFWFRPVLLVRMLQS